MQSSPNTAILYVQTETSRITEKRLQNFLEPTRRPNVIYIDHSVEFGKSCQDLSWNHCTSTPQIGLLSFRILNVKLLHRRPFLSPGSAKCFFFSNIEGTPVKTPGVKARKWILKSWNITSRRVRCRHRAHCAERKRKKATKAFPHFQSARNK